MAERKYKSGDKNNMKLLYGTGNPAKLEVMRERLKVLGIEIMATAIPLALDGGLR